MRPLIGILVGGVLAAQSPPEPLVAGSQGRWLRPGDVEAIARAAAPHGGRPWLISNVRRTTPTRNKEYRWFAYAYLAPARATAEFPRICSRHFPAGTWTADVGHCARHGQY